jgi:ribosomal protein S18 acetylase RimI-like enzyme
VSTSSEADAIVVEVVRGADAALAAAVARLLPQLDPTARPPSAWVLQAIIDAPASMLLVVCTTAPRREIVGMLTLSIVATPTGVHAWIDDVVVDEAARGRGAGERLVREALRLADARGASSVALTSRPERVAANRLYQRLGFERRETNVYRHAIARDHTVP